MGRLGDDAALGMRLRVRDEPRPALVTSHEDDDSGLALEPDV